MKKILLPKYFLLGIIFGFLLCCSLGYFISKKARFHHFQRFYSAITPQMQYYPTAHELLMTAQHKVKKDKILVLVGGNSIFRGVGQNPRELWTLELQKILGNKFKVLNYAIDSANLTSFGGVAFRILKEKYSKIIFVATSFPEGIGDIDGGVEVYEYLFWDAYYKSLVKLNLEEQKTLDTLRTRQLRTLEGKEKHLLGWLDSFFYARNLWNWINYHVLFTVWTNDSAKSLFRARLSYKDRNFANLVKDFHKLDAVHFEAGMKILESIIMSFVDVHEPNVKLSDKAFLSRQRNLESSFSLSDRSKILCVIPKENPRYLNALPPNLQLAHTMLFDYVYNLTEKLGYNAIIVGQNFSPDDYVDGRHFSPSGGCKTAVVVASKVQEMANGM